MAQLLHPGQIDTSQPFAALTSSSFVTGTQFAASTGSYELKADGYFYSSNGGGAGSPRSGILALGSSQNLAVITANTTRYQIDSTGNFTRTVPGGSTLLPDFSCRLWVNFNGTNGALNGSGNVSSVTRVTTGQYTINFSTALPDTFYAGVATTQTSGNQTSVAESARGTTTFQVRPTQESNGAANYIDLNCSVAIFR